MKIPFSFLLFWSKHTNPHFAAPCFWLLIKMQALLLQAVTGT